uniref:Uncharacterized protein n=1 Tax=viral metagenome TaxID=1070528 RepID=A0A6M3JE88_9ZZZZ
MYNIQFIDFIDYICSMRSKTDRLIALCLMAGMTQKETSIIIKKTQPYVCNRLKKIRNNYKNV